MSLGTSSAAKGSHPSSPKRRIVPGLAVPGLDTTFLRPPFFRRCLPWLVLFVAWLVIYGPPVLTHMRLGAEPSALADDMRIQLPHFYHYSDSRLFPNDPVGQYHSDGTGEFFRWIYMGFGKLVDIVAIGKALTYVLWFATAVGVAVAANGLAGKPAAFVAVCVVMGSNGFLDRIVGGLPRGFAYPFLAWAAAFLVTGRIRALAVLTVLGAGFYPVIPVVAGLALALVLLVMPRRDRGSARHWSFKRRVAVLALAGLGSAAVMAPFALRMRAHGAVIQEGDVKAFPEAGDGGRLVAFDRVPPPFLDVAGRVASRTLLGLQPFVPPIRYLFRPHRHLSGPIFATVGVITVLGVMALGVRRRGRGVRRLAALALAVFVAYLLARAVHPRLAPTERYPLFGVPPLVAILVPSAVLGLWPRRLRLPGRLARWTTPAWVSVCAAVLLAFFGGRGKPVNGWDTHVSQSERRVFAVLGRLPRSAVIAGFPSGIMDDVPLGALRTAFVNYQMFMPYHQGMTRLMRERVSAVIDAYYSPDLDALKVLRDRYGVTHFLYDPGRANGSSLFRPFGAQIKRQVARLKARDAASALATYSGPAVVFRQERYVLLDLAKL